MSTSQVSTTVVKYICKQFEFIRPNGGFYIPNFRNRGLIATSIEFDKSCEKTLRDNVKELKVTCGSRILYKGLSGAYFAHSNIINFEPFESEILNSNGQIQIIVNSAINTKEANVVIKPLNLTFTINYKETFGEPKQTYTVANMEEFIKVLRNQRNPYKFAFRPQNPLPTGFVLDLKFEIKDVADAGYDIFNLSTIQQVQLNGALIEWDFGFIQDSIVREHFCQMVEPSITQKNICPWPMNIIVYGAAD
jgi:hypothetical protein